MLEQILLLIVHKHQNIGLITVENVLSTKINSGLIIDADIRAYALWLNQSVRTTREPLFLSHRFYIRTNCLTLSPASIFSNFLLDNGRANFNGGRVPCISQIVIIRTTA